MDGGNLNSNTTNNNGERLIDSLRLVGGHQMSSTEIHDANNFIKPNSNCQ